MTYQWKQSEGVLLQSGRAVSRGYAGAPGYVNETSSESLKNKGPLPRGGYSITLIYPRHAKFGPACCVLQPDTTNRMFGRSAFLIHADSIKNPGAASEGCIILDYKTRLIFKVGDRIEVI